MFRRSTVNLVEKSLQVQVRSGSSINVILLKDLENKGKSGEIVSVKRGHARNLLIPRKIVKFD